MKSFVKSGGVFRDLRREVSAGYKCEIEENSINKINYINRRGSLYRIAAEDRFYCATNPRQLLNIGMGETAFSRYIKSLENIWGKKTTTNPEMAKSYNQDEFLKLARSLVTGPLKASITREVRKVEYVNSLGICISKVESFFICRLDLKKEHKKIHLRRILYDPTPQDLFSAIRDLKDTDKLLRKAEHVAAYDRRVLLHPSVAGVLIHEIIGHAAEAISAPGSLEYLQREFTMSPLINVEDRAIGYPFDDEGILSRTVNIINDGRFCEPLVSLEDAYKLKASPNGRGRAKDFRHPVTGRMMNICLLPGQNEFDEMLGEIKKGFYLMGSLGGLSVSDNFQIKTQYGFEVNNGKIGRPIIGPMIFGGSFNVVRQISHVGTDFKEELDGGCYSNQQFLDRSGRISPHILCNGINLG